MPKKATRRSRRRVFTPQVYLKLIRKNVKIAPEICKKGRGLYSFKDISRKRIFVEAALQLH